LKGRDDIVGPTSNFVTYFLRKTLLLVGLDKNVHEHMHNEQRYASSDHHSIAHLFGYTLTTSIGHIDKLKVLRDELDGSGREERS
jgi:hypothetical protein